MSFITRHGCIVEAPEQLSVNELKQWLSNFGDQHRQHFEKNQLTARRAAMQSSGTIHYRTQNLEKRISPSSTASSTDSLVVSSSGTSSPNPNEAEQELMIQVTSPVFHVFEDSSEQPERLLDHFDQAPLGVQVWQQRRRGVSQLMPMTRPTDAEDRLVYFPLPPSWHPNAQPTEASFHYDTENVVSSITLEDELEGASTGTGWHTDPGTTSLSEHHCARTPHRRSKDDTDVKKNNQKPDSSIPRKFPLLLWKLPQKKKPATADDVFDDTLYLRDDLSVSSDLELCPNDHDEDSDGLLDSHQGSSLDLGMFAESMLLNNSFASLSLEHNHCTSTPVHSDRGEKDPPCSQSEETTASTRSEDSVLPTTVPGAIHFQLSEVFSEETKKMNSQAIFNARYGIGRFDSSGSDSKPDTWKQGPAAPKCTNFKRGSTYENSKQPVSGVAQQFGGVVNNKSAIQRRKEELERKWAEDRVPSHVKKVKWHFSNSGGYKKKVVLHYKC